MAVLFDTAAVPPRHRLAALHEAYDSETPPRTIVVDPRTVRHRIECLDLGVEMRLLRVGGGALQIVRTGRQVRADPTEYLALGFHRQGLTQVSVGGLDTDVSVGHLNVVDLTQPYRLTHLDDNDHEVLVVSNRQVGVSVDTVRSAGPALAGSPSTGWYVDTSPDCSRRLVTCRRSLSSSPDKPPLPSSVP